MSLFEPSYMGRGLRIIIETSPLKNESDIDFFKWLGKPLVEPLHSIASISPFSDPDDDIKMMSAISKNYNLRKYFKNIDIKSYARGNEQAKKGKLDKDAFYIKIFCPDALFRVKLSDAEKVYTEMFYDIYGMIGSICLNILHTKFSVIEYSFLYRFMPKEKPGEFVPMVALKTVGAFLIWGALYVKNRKENIIKNISNEDDRKRLKEILKDTDDGRPVVSQNKDFILKMAEQTGVWKPYRTKEDVRISPQLSTSELEAEYKILNEKKATGYYHYMPFKENEIKVISEYLKDL